ncbi:MAG: CdaR family protein [Chloroflexota bacterium]
MIRWFVRNLGTMVLALILAIVVWIVAAQEENPIVARELSEPVPILYANLPDGVVISNNPPIEMKLGVYGPEKTLDALQISDFIIEVDLASVPYGGIQVPLQISVDEPHVKVTSQQYETVEVVLEEYRTRSIPVDVILVGSVAIGHVAGEATIDPDAILLEGPSSVLDPVHKAEIRVSIEGARETIQETSLVQLRNKEGLQLTGFDVADLQVSATVPITKSDEYTELFVTVDLSGTIASGYRLTDYKADPTKVTIFGAPDVIAALPGFVSTEPVDVTNADVSLTRRVGLLIPEGVTVIGSQDVVVEIMIEPVITTLTFPWRPTVFGPEIGYTATLSVDVVNVTLVGPLDLIDIFNPESDLAMSLSLYGLDVGAHEVEPVVVSRIQGVEVERLLPTTILVEISLVPTPEPGSNSSSGSSNQQATPSATPSPTVSP